MRHPSTPARSDRALVLRVTPYGESDAVVTLLTETDGVLSALARRARASSPRKGVMIEPFHTLAVELVAGRGELAILRTSTIAVARAALLEDSERLATAGLATRWVRTLSPPHVPEPSVFAALETLLDRLAAGVSPERVLLAFGLTLLDALGYGLALSGCARCSCPRPTGKAAFVAAAMGGVVCEACRASVHLNETPLSGELLDALASNPDAAVDPTRASESRVPRNFGDAGATGFARALRVVRDAIDFRARSLGARTGTGKT